MNFPEQSPDYFEELRDLGGVLAAMIAGIVVVGLIVAPFWTWYVG